MGTDASRTRPLTGISTSASDVFTTQAVLPLRNASVPGGASSHERGALSPKRRRLALTPATYVACTDVASLRSTSAQYRENAAGWGSHGAAGDAASEKPKLGAS